MPSLWLGLAAGLCTGLANSLAILFGFVLVLAIMISGVVMIVAPLHAKPLFKNAAIALGLFVLSSVLLSAFCVASSALKMFAELLVYLISCVIASVAALFLITVSFVYFFNPGLALKWLRKFGIVFAGLLFFLMLIWPFASSHPLVTFIGLVLLSIG